MKNYPLLVVSLVLLIAQVAVLSDVQAAKNGLPDNSVYHLESSWRDQRGEAFDITELQGSVRLVAFVYTYCEHTCPVIIAKIKLILKDLSEDARKNTVVTLVSLDPERDTVERVREYMQTKNLDAPGWQILVGTPDDVLSLSALFDVRYKPMGESDIAHSNVITLVDKQGVIQNRLRGIGQSAEELIKILEALD